MLRVKDIMESCFRGCNGRCKAMHIHPRWVTFVKHDISWIESNVSDMFDATRQRFLNTKVKFCHQFLIIEHDESQQNFLIIIPIYLYNNDLQQTPSSSIIRTYRKKFTRINQIFFVSMDRPNLIRRDIGRKSGNFYRLTIFQYPGNTRENRSRQGGRR